MLLPGLLCPLHGGDASGVEQVLFSADQIEDGKEVILQPLLYSEVTPEGGVLPPVVEGLLTL